MSCAPGSGSTEISGRQLRGMRGLRPVCSRPAAAPADLAGMDAIFLGQHAADPDACGLLKIRDADLAALERRRGIDAAVVADIDRGMAEGSRDEGGDADIGPLAARRRQQMCAEGELGDVELAMAEGALEDLLGMAATWVTAQPSMATRPSSRALVRSLVWQASDSSRTMISTHITVAQKAKTAPSPRTSRRHGLLRLGRVLAIRPVEDRHSNALCSSLGAAVPVWARSSSAISIRCLPLATCRKLAS